MSPIKITIKIVFMLLLFTIITQSATGQETTLDKYIKQGLKSNLALQQKLSQYNKSLQVLKQAKGLFLPEISINARYSVARGGRIIEMPFGDMLNPVYSTLNMLTASNSFPQIENQQMCFYREKEHETKVRLTQAIFNPQIYYNYKIQSALAKVEKADAEVYKKELTAEIKTAYFNYLKAVQINKALAATEKLLRENIRVNEKLFENNKVTIDVVYRSKAELSELEQQKAEAVKNNQFTASYFNFLLNRAFDAEIDLMDYAEFSIQPINIETAQNSALQHREELTMLEYNSNAVKNTLKLNKSSYLPSLSAAVDYGFQGEEYKFSNDDDFMLASLVLKWDLFTGFQRKAKIQQAKIDRHIVETQYAETKRQIKLQVLNSYHNVIAAQKSILAAEAQLNSAKKAFNIIDKKYKKGQASLIEFMDARTSMTNAEQNLIIAKYDYQIKYADYERVSGL